MNKEQMSTFFKAMPNFFNDDRCRSVEKMIRHDMLSDDRVKPSVPMSRADVEKMEDLNESSEQLTQVVLRMLGVKK